MKTELLTSEIFENMFGSYLKSKDGFNIYFETNLRDSETALVFLYGLGCNISHWKYQINYFLQ